MKHDVWDMNDPRNLTRAYKGGAPAKSQTQIDAEKAQAKELEDLQAKETSRTEAMKRKRRGRGSLLSGGETGQSDELKQTLGGA